MNERYATEVLTPAQLPTTEACNAQLEIINAAEAEKQRLKTEMEAAIARANGLRRQLGYPTETEAFHRPPTAEMTEQLSKLNQQQSEYQANARDHALELIDLLPLGPDNIIAYTRNSTNYDSEFYSDRYYYDIDTTTTIQRTADMVYVHKQPFDKKRGNIPQPGTGVIAGKDIPQPLTFTGPRDHVLRGLLLAKKTSWPSFEQTMKQVDEDIQIEVLIGETIALTADQPAIVDPYGVRKSFSATVGSGVLMASVSYRAENDYATVYKPIRSVVVEKVGDDTKSSVALDIQSGELQSGYGSLRKDNLLGRYRTMLDTIKLARSAGGI